MLRTGETEPAEGVRALGVPFETLDALRAGSRRFDALNKKLAAEVLRMAKEGDVVYCVDGSACDDLSARILVQRARGARVIAGCSKADSAFAAAGAGGATISSAMVLNFPHEGHLPSQRGLVAPHSEQTKTVVCLAMFLYSP